MSRDDFDVIERAARARRARELPALLRRAVAMLARLLVREPTPPRRSGDEMYAAERFVGLSNFQERLKNSRPPRIAVIRSINRSKCSGTSTKFRRSLFTISSGLSE